jgi:hypothetical protein
MGLNKSNFRVESKIQGEDMDESGWRLDWSNTQIGIEVRFGACRYRLTAERR